MKSQIIVLVILFGFIHIFPQQNELENYYKNKLNTRTITTQRIVGDIFLVTESIEQEWINSAWQNVSRNTYSYDSSITNYLTTTEIWDNNQWVNETQYWPTLDGNGNTIEEVYKAWVDPSWVNSERYLYEYDGNGKVTVETSQSWNVTEWVNSNRTVYTYTNNHLTEKLYQQWNVTDWSNVDRHQYTYVNNNLTEELFQQYISGWNNVSLIQNSYNSQNNIIETLNKRWDNGTWFLEMKYTNQYSNGNLTVITMQEGRIDTLWTNIGLYTKNYNSNNLLVEYISQYWHSLNGWINQQRWILTYLPDNRPVEWVTQFWQNNNWGNFSRLISTYDVNGNETVFAWDMWQNSAWENHVQILYNYTSVSPVEDDPLNKLNYSLFQNYPNPFNPNTKISWQSPVGSHQTLIVFDVLGNKIKTLLDEYKPAGKYEIDFNASELSSGVYFMRLEAGNHICIKKMILLR